MTAPATPPDWDAIARYLAGESGTDEAAVVRAWLDSHPADRALVDRLDSVVLLNDVADVDVERALGRVHERLSKSARTVLHVKRGGARRSNRIAIVAALAVAAALTFVLVRSRSHSPATSSAAGKHYAAGVAKIDSVRLADGSLVILGPQSTLDLPGTFGVGDRTVVLTGDAYFDVRHDATRPFRVRAGSAVIEDIGTTFTIESDAAVMATVSVVSGSVRLSRADSSTTPVVLEAGDRGSLGATGDARVERNVLRPEDTAWISGRLAFRDAPLSRVAAEMERWYGVKVHIADPTLLGRRVTTSFEGESIDKALEILELTLGANVTREGDSVIVSGPRGSRLSR